jgi:hypothetical protein
MNNEYDVILTGECRYKIQDPEAKTGQGYRLSDPTDVDKCLHNLQIIL